MEYEVNTVTSARNVAVYPDAKGLPASLLDHAAHVYVAETPAALLRLSRAAGISAIALTIGPGTVEQAELVRDIKAHAPSVWCTVIGCPGSEELALAALRAGADEYISAKAAKSGSSKVRVFPKRGPRLIGGDPATHRMFRQFDRIAATSSTVLITGETGTGKEMAARYIHDNGERRSQPFICVNCAAVPDTLLESELFGHERGAYTGAQSSAEGKFQQANHGTLFLDEIADMSSTAQAKILRVLETREVWKLGASRGSMVNVRVIAATNQDVEQLVAEGRFRPDLYYRLNVARLTLLPLRERPGDIPLLIAYYVEQMNLQFRRKLSGFTEASMKRLQSYGWPGNVRELKNVLEAAYIDLPEGRIHLAELPANVRARLQHAAKGPEDEAGRIVTALNAMHWNVSKAAQQLKVSRMTLYRKIAKYGLSRQATSA